MTRADELLAQSGRLLNLSFVQRRLGDEEAAMESLDRAAAVASAYLEGFTGEWLLDARSKQVARVFDELAWAHARAGAPDQALAAVEAVRSATVRMHTMSDAQRNERTLAMLLPGTPRMVARVVDGESRVYLDEDPVPAPDSLVLPPIASTLEVLLRRLETIPTALVSLVQADARGLTALICWPDGTVVSEQWAPSTDGAFPDAGYDAPGLFRERRLQAISRARYESFFAPVDRRLRRKGIKRIVISAPGWLARFPFEALFDGDGFVGDRYQVQYLPSLRVGADLAQNTASKRSRTRALVVGYAGDDLPCSAEEQEGIRRQLPGRVTVMSPAECTKVSVLKELQGEYDIVHFGCHASYDESNPLNAALRLVWDPQDDGQRITAYELMEGVRFKRAPIVTLSACASGVMDLSMTNSAYGLVGGFLRAGAHCVIGTRWPVYDKTAATTMIKMYERHARTGDAIPQCLYAVTSEMRATAGIENWAAFGCIGVP